MFRCYIVHYKSLWATTALFHRDYLSCHKLLFGPETLNEARIHIQQLQTYLSSKLFTGEHSMFPFLGAHACDNVLMTTEQSCDDVETKHGFMCFLSGSNWSKLNQTWPQRTTPAEAKPSRRVNVIRSAFTISYHGQSTYQPLCVNHWQGLYLEEHRWPARELPAAATMIDLSYLTEEEQVTILAVLKRDAELKKADEHRVLWVSLAPH